MPKPVVETGIISEKKYRLTNLLWWIFLPALFVTYSVSLNISSTFHAEKQVLFVERQTLLYYDTPPPPYVAPEIQDKCLPH